MSSIFKKFDAADAEVGLESPPAVTEWAFDDDGGRERAIPEKVYPEMTSFAREEGREDSLSETTPIESRFVDVGGRK